MFILEIILRPSGLAVGDGFSPSCMPGYFLAVLVSAGNEIQSPFKDASILYFVDHYGH